MSTRPLRRLFPLLLLVLGARSALAQCPLPDQLDGGPCCAIANAQIPLVPDFALGAQGICWRDCNVDLVGQVKSRWKKLTTQIGLVAPCGEQQMRLSLLNGANALLWRGNVRLVYSRTWIAVDTSGLALQVWRFLVNGDLTPYPAAGAPPCPVPSCAAAFGNRVRFSGYLDMTEDCGSAGGARFSWMLTHACDAIDHHAGFPRAGAFHPDRSFSFVGPAAGFVPGPLQPTEGTLASGYDSVRQRFRTPAPVSILCGYEEPVTHTLTPLQQLCLCGAPGTNQVLIGSLAVQGACGTALRTPPGGGPFLPGYTSMGLGSWTNPNAWPGVQALRWNAGGYDTFDACNGALTHEVFLGVTTFGGFPAFELVGGNPGNPLPPVFVDQASAQRPNGAPVMNVPYTSYWVLGLNQ